MGQLYYVQFRIGGGRFSAGGLSGELLGEGNCGRKKKKKKKKDGEIK